MLSWDDVARHIYSPQRNRGYRQTRQVILAQDQLGGPLNLLGLLTDVWVTQGWSTTEECPVSLSLLFLTHPHDHMQQVKSEAKSHEREWWLSLVDEGTNRLFTSVS